MTIKYRNVDFVFDAVKFGRDVRRVRTENLFTQDALAFALGWQSGTTISAIENANTLTTLRNYIELCNLLDLDPRAYFSLAE